MSEIQGLPSHPLLVHGPVVLVPLLALLALAMVVKRSWRVSLGPWVVLLAIVMLGMTAIAAGSGEDLQANVRDTEQVRHHAELGSAMRPIAFAFFVAIVLLVAPAWAYARGGPKMLANLATSSAWNIIIVVLVIATSILATYWIIQTGHSGATAVWHNVKIIKSGEG